MSRRILGVLGVLASLSVPTAMVVVYGPELMRTWKTPREQIQPDTRTPAEKLAERHRWQLKMLAEHRGLFEAAARDEPGKRDELRNTVNVDCYQDGMSFCIRWNDGQGAHFSTWFGLYYSPNGERDLPERFWNDPIRYYDPMKIDDHWFAAKEPGG